jgi:hypothetical protein
VTSKFASRLPKRSSFYLVTLSGLPSELYRAESICKRRVGIVTCDGVDTNAEWRPGVERLWSTVRRYSRVAARSALLKLGKMGYSSERVLDRGGARRRSQKTSVRLVPRIVIS